jgi:hypothetical protein
MRMPNRLSPMNHTPSRFSNPKGITMEYQKYTRHCFKRLTADEVREFREMQEAQSIAWMTGNKSRAAELGKMLAELRNSNLAYRNLYA